jgi:phytanoyl-CoA hydroxylase
MSNTTDINPKEIQRQFAEDGYYHARGVFTPEEVTAQEADFDNIVRQILGTGEDVNARWGGPEMEKLGAAGTTIFHTHNVQRYSALWLRALLNERLLAYVTAILGPDVVLHHTKLFQKPTETGSPFPMHQDWSYFPTVNDTMMAGIIHVSDATDEMGCLRVYPGTHRLGRLESSGGMTAAGAALADYPLEKALPLEAKAGDVLFFHYFTLHGSMPNRSQRVRKTVLTQMYAGTDRVEDGVSHPDEQLVLCGRNHAMSRNRANVKR